MELDLAKLEHHFSCCDYTPWEHLASFSLKEMSVIAAGYAPCCVQRFLEGADRDPAVAHEMEVNELLIRRAVYAEEMKLCRGLGAETLDLVKSYVTRAAMFEWLNREDKPLGLSERRSLLVLLRAVVDGAYSKYQPGKRVPVKEIREDMERAGVKILDDDTISKWVRAAWEVETRQVDS